MNELNLIPHGTKVLIEIGDAKIPGIVTSISIPQPNIVRYLINYICGDTIKELWVDDFMIKQQDEKNTIKIGFKNVNF